MAVLVGVAAGAAVGMLFASDKVSNVRRNIAEKGEETVDTLNNEIAERLDDLLDAVIGKVKKSILAKRAPLDAEESTI